LLRHNINTLQPIAQAIAQPITIGVKSMQLQSLLLKEGIHVLLG